ncbi:hypothetical protein CAL20_15500 [Bordetella genomosp. 4]|uniref:Uncharacterized protein n=1 Tax=Bordetella genomosp. 4 TaxID=463044 RepID=A0A261U5F3_9BORD|nr:hypothetical protein CAL21_12975 [Bordetella genomosp. 4]OZI56801.1 hypothetical protein CAL20_15500 [Bordetella genomosp. 4]
MVEPVAHPAGRLGLRDDQAIRTGLGPRGARATLIGFAPRDGQAIRIGLGPKGARVARIGFAPKDDQTIRTGLGLKAARATLTGFAPRGAPANPGFSPTCNLARRAQ